MEFISRRRSNYCKRAGLAQERGQSDPAVCPASRECKLSKFRVEFQIGKCQAARFRESRQDSRGPEVENFAEQIHFMPREAAATGDGEIFRLAVPSRVFCYGARTCEV